MIKKLIFVFCICIRLRINPFRKMDTNAIKYKYRLNEKEKQWIISNCHPDAVDYFNHMFYSEDN